MKKRPLSEDVIERTDANPEETARLLERFNVNEMWEKQFPNNPNTTKMQAYVERLTQEGLDIGKGNATFGYKMPLPDKKSTTRILQIYRRR